MSLKFKFNIAKSSANFGNDAFLFFLTVSNEGNGEAYEMSRIIPRYGGDQFLANQILGEILAGFKTAPAFNAFWAST